MSEVTNIEGYLTVKQGDRLFVEQEPSVLVIGESADKENWDHKWYLKDISFPVPLEEAIKMFDDSLARLGSSDGWYDVTFKEKDGARTFTGKALIHALAYNGVKITLQGATELAS